MSITTLAAKLKHKDLFVISHLLKTETDAAKRADYERALANGEAYNAELAVHANGLRLARSHR